MIVWITFAFAFTCCCVTIVFLSANGGPVNLLTAGTVCKRIVWLAVDVRFCWPPTTGDGPTRNNWNWPFSVFNRIAWPGWPEFCKFCSALSVNCCCVKKKCGENVIVIVRYENRSATELTVLLTPAFVGRAPTICVTTRGDTAATVFCWVCWLAGAFGRTFRIWTPGIIEVWTIFWFVPYEIKTKYWVSYCLIEFVHLRNMLFM